MAVTWIGSIRHARMDKTVNYAVNPVKTAYESGKQENACMTANIAYALNPEKGAANLYQTVINLDSVETAWQEMRQTKERWGRMDGIMGFHLVQSFKPGETTPDMAHRIGVELIQRCFPGFEAVIGTHLDKAHIHNHVVINSVSCLDGHKYHSSRQSYYGEIRKVSDELCRRYGLSIVEPEAGSRAKPYAEWQAEREGRPTWTSAIREDVDAAIRRSLSFEQFVRNLRAQGYEVKTQVKHIAVRPPGKERFTRLRRLGDQYTEEAIRQRIMENDPSRMLEDLLETPPKPQTPVVRKIRYRGTWKNPNRPKVRGLRALYLWYAYRMGNMRKGGSSRKTHYLLREDIRKLEKRDRMAGLLIKNRIETFEQLHSYQNDCRKMVDFLCNERSQLKAQPESEAVQSELDDIREKLKALRREIRLCDAIESDSVELEKKREQIRRMETEQRKQKETAKSIRGRSQRTL